MNGTITPMAGDALVGSVTTDNNTILAGEINTSGSASLSGAVMGHNVILATPAVDGITIIEGGGGPIVPATTETLGGIIVGDDLTITEEGRLSVDKTDEFSADNTKPVTASAVYTQIGNINALLATI